MKKLGKPDDPPWVGTVREGKGVEVKAPPAKEPKDDPSVRVIRRATVESRFEGTVFLTVDGKPMALDAVMQVGDSVDVVVEAGRMTPFPILFEARPAKGK